MEKVHLFMRALALLLSIITGFFGGLLPHKADRFYTADEIAAYTAAAEAAYPDGMIIAIGGGFNTDKNFRPIVERCLSHVGKAQPNMLFVPTASHDEYAENDAIITRFAAAGCRTDVLTVSTSSAREVAQKFEWADIVYATGGSLKFLTENWLEKGVYAAADQALRRGAVLLGVSSGAMCWADKGWDDTEPETLRNIAHGPFFVGKAPGFAYFDCAGLLPFCLTPHYDSIGWRSYTYEAQKADYPSVCVENGAALVCEGGRYSVLSDAATPTRSVFLFYPARGIRFVNLRADAALAAVVDGEIRCGRANG
ncbi:MAG: Type 1 glutamine amidotransferase-like domain-containing protein [Clostridia bacterium]|nr:Type 1 glutamine amidotransferase-like domain-containing protein [Clostridia bacterium]